ncbi:VOC family protein [Aquihabitans sp. G128]|uniref:VOC family protein n=1 Tax=Aquihabitans sp. G128 TaxID=2849779 RepID=UPI001C21128B|nr:VOC family protein [Aquihabitans sp. G128]QXC63230.1 VOC family protein [Aquihabitans sp. G128]
MATVPATPTGPRLVELLVADAPSAWADAGFHVADDRVVVGTVAFVLTGGAAGGASERGITGWRLSGVDPAGVVDGRVDGLPTELVEADGTTPDTDAAPHPNGVVGLDHVVVSTPDLERTIGAFTATGLDLRRIRGTDETGTGLRQAFFRLGPTILEVVSGPEPSGRPAAQAPASWFGVAVDVADLDATAALLGEGLGPVKAAVQLGRRIATLRHKAFAMTVAVAAMDDGPSR